MVQSMQFRGLKLEPKRPTKWFRAVQGPIVGTKTGPLNGSEQFRGLKFVTKKAH
jgi:hypothetical protein